VKRTCQWKKDNNDNKHDFDVHIEDISEENEETE
jgi:hypothetical protein